MSLPFSAAVTNFIHSLLYCPNFGLGFSGRITRKLCFTFYSTLQRPAGSSRTHTLRQMLFSRFRNVLP